LPSPATIDGWLAQTGADFRFSFKAPQRITHIKRLKECSDALSAFYSALLPVIRAGRMGVVLFQLPPNLKADPDRLASLPQRSRAGEHSTLRVAFEFRHASWFASEIFDLLRQHQAALCVAESDELQTPDVVTAPFCCYRLRKSDYGPADLQQIEKQLDRKASAGRCFRLHQARGLAQRRVAGGLPAGEVESAVRDESDLWLKPQATSPRRREEFFPRRFLRNGHLQTLVGNFLPRQYVLPEAEAHIIQVDAGDGDAAYGDGGAAGG
jgi:hypothetical protein